jgi:hypothetical protein
MLEVQEGGIEPRQAIAIGHTTIVERRRGPRKRTLVRPDSEALAAITSEV